MKCSISKRFLTAVIVFCAALGAQAQIPSVINGDELKALGYQRYSCSANITGGLSFKTQLQVRILATNDSEALKSFLTSEKIYASVYEGKTYLRIRGNGDGPDTTIKDINCKLAE